MYKNIQNKKSYGDIKQKHWRAITDFNQNGKISILFFYSNEVYLFDMFKEAISFRCQYKVGGFPYNSAIKQLKNLILE